MMEDLKAYRDRIDEIDAQLVALFEKRMEIVLEIADYKKSNNICRFLYRIYNVFFG